MGNDIQGFLSKWGVWLGLGAAVFFVSYLLFGRKNAAATKNPTANSPTATPLGGTDANGNPVVEYVPTSGDAYTNVDWNSNSGNSSVVTSQSTASAPGGNITQYPPITQTGLAPAMGGTTMDNPSTGIPVAAPAPPVSVVGGSQTVTHPTPLPPVAAPPPPHNVPPPPVNPIQKAISDWQTANKRSWTGPAGSFPYGWGPNPYGSGAGVVNNGIFHYVVAP